MFQRPPDGFIFKSFNDSLTSGEHVAIGNKLVEINLWPGCWQVTTKFDSTCLFSFMGTPNSTFVQPVQLSLNGQVIDPFGFNLATNGGLGAQSVYTVWFSFRTATVLKLQYAVALAPSTSGQFYGDVLANGWYEDANER